MHRIAPALEHLIVPIDTVRPYPRNPRNGDTDAIARSLRAHGQVAPVVYQRTTGYLLHGNHTTAAALELGWTHIAASPLDVDDRKAATLVLAMNRSSDLAKYDEPLLLELLADVQTAGDIDDTLWDPYALDDLLNRGDKFGDDVLGDTNPSVTCPRCSHTFAPGKQTRGKDHR